MNRRQILRVLFTAQIAGPFSVAAPSLKALFPRRGSDDGITHSELMRVIEQIEVVRPDVPNPGRSRCGEPA